MFKLTLMIATFAFLVGASTDALFAMLDDTDQSISNKALGPILQMPHELMEVIFLETSKVKNPRHLTSVCKHWYSVMREDNIPKVAAELHYSATNILDSKIMNPFKQKCMNTYWQNLFYNGVLRYTPTYNSAEVTLKFSDFKNETLIYLSVETLPTPSL